MTTLTSSERFVCNVLGLKNRFCFINVLVIFEVENQADNIWEIPLFRENKFLVRLGSLV